jgi:hypothetical protein
MKLTYKLSLWLPFVYSIALCCIALHFIGIAKEPASTALISFLGWLPMAFYFVAQVTLGYVSKLEKRLDSLETKLKALDH